MKLFKRKSNYDRHNRFTELPAGFGEVCGCKDTLNNMVLITLNSDAVQGEYQYRVELSEEDVKSLKWLFE